MDFEIESVHARQVFDSRGRPTVEVEVRLGGGSRGSAIVPSGASTGRHEAVELRDHDPARFGGFGVQKAVANVNDVIAPMLQGLDATDQAGIDGALIELDGSSDKSRLGANALLGTSLAVAQAAASASSAPLWQYLLSSRQPILPLPMINIISGGLHASHNLDFQDFLIVPIGAESFSEALEMAVGVYVGTRDVLAEMGLSTLKADEGGFGPALAGNRAAAEVLVKGIERAGYRPGDDISIALDVAATHFYNPQTSSYRLAADSQERDSTGMVDMLTGWVDEFPIISVEDGLSEDDWSGWKTLTDRLGSAVHLIGDDLFTTNPERLQRGIEAGIANAVLVKMNQIGTLTETLHVIDMAQNAGYRVIVSGRSGESEDTSMADLAVATGAGQIKIGSVAQSERLAKYNRLLRIEEQLGRDAVFAGRSALT
jgi:enolase